MGMEFLYFPEDKSEYLPGIISVIVIILLSAVIFRLLIRASRREVEKLEQQGLPANYENGAGARVDKEESREQTEQKAQTKQQLNEHKS